MGIRDITQLYRADKKGKARALELESLGPINIQHQSGSSRIAQASDSLSGRPPDLFAADVNVRGWKIVGGEKWSGDAKVGAYVGKLSKSASLRGRRRANINSVYDIEITKRAVSQASLSFSHADLKGWRDRDTAPV